MGAHRASISARALAWVFAAGVGLSPAAAAAADKWPPPAPWPPTTAPVIPSAAPPAPAVVEPLPEPAPQPETPSPEPHESSEPQPSQPSPGSDDESVISRQAEEPEPGWRDFVGLSENRFFVRTAKNELVLFPGGVLDLEARSFQTSNLDVPDQGFHVDRARLEVAGLVRDIVSFNAAVNLDGAPSARGVDNYLAVQLPPWGNRVIVQAGQFDAPFTMDNRISDRSLDFLERSTLARTFAVPENKADGLMVHGTNPDRKYYYSGGVFFGNGETDAMGRAWLAPFAFRPSPEIVRNITVGASVRLGQARGGSLLPAQTTQSGFVFLDTQTRWLDGADVTDVDLRTRGTLTAIGLEVNAPIRHKYGARFEWTAKNQPLESVSVTDGGAPVTHGGMSLGGWATYGEVWCWVLGDDRIVGEQGLQLPVHLGTLGLPRSVRALTGVMLAARLEYLDEDLGAGSDPMAAANVISAGNTKLTALTVGANVWLARRVRGTLNYGLNHLSGSSLFMSGLTDSNVQELTFALSLVL
jgi:hypothetical protein